MILHIFFHYVNFVDKYLLKSTIENFRKIEYNENIPFVIAAVSTVVYIYAKIYKR